MLLIWRSSLNTFTSSLYDQTDFTSFSRQTALWAEHTTEINSWPGQSWSWCSGRTAWHSLWWSTGCQTPPVCQLVELQPAETISHITMNKKSVFLSYWFNYIQVHLLSYEQSKQNETCLFSKSCNRSHIGVDWMESLAVREVQFTILHILLILRI